MIGIYNDSSSTSFSVSTYGEIVWLGGSINSYYIQYGDRTGQSFSQSQYSTMTFSINGTTYYYADYWDSSKGSYYFTDFDGIITSSAFYNRNYDVGNLFMQRLETNALIIQDDAFRDMSYLSYVSLTNCEEIGAGAFERCYLYPLFQASCCKYVGSYAFQSSPGIGAVYTSNTNPGSIELPECERVGIAAFKYCYHLKSISLPKCKTLDGWTFGSCTSLSKAFFDICEYVGPYTFADCTQAGGIHIPSCTYLGKGAFRRCYNLHSIAINNCSYIGDAAFESCSSLSLVYMRGCEYIGTQAFFDCLSLNITLSLSKCSYIGPYAFRSCYSLGYSVSLPVCKTIESHAFESVSGSMHLDLPTCEYIGDFAFAYCKIQGYVSGTQWIGGINLLGSKVCQLGGSSVFYSTNWYNAKIYVPSSLYSEYLSASYWYSLSNKLRSYTD